MYAESLRYLRYAPDPDKPQETRGLTRAQIEVFVAYQRLEQRQDSVRSWYGFSCVNRRSKYVCKVAGCCPSTLFEALRVLELPGVNLISRRQVTVFRGQEQVKVHSARRKRHYGQGWTWKTLQRGPRRGPSMIRLTEHAREVTGAPDPVEATRNSMARPTPRQAPMAQLIFGEQSIRAHAEAMFDQRLSDCPQIFGKLDREEWIVRWVESNRGGIYGVTTAAEARARGDPPRAGPGAQAHLTVH